jgi:hypothetical protein
MTTPLITNVVPVDGSVAAVGCSSRCSVRDSATEINRASLCVYLGSGPVFYKGAVLPEDLVGPPTFYFEALSGHPGVPAITSILVDDYLRINKAVPSQNQEAVYLMGGLEAPADPDDPLMFEFTLRLNRLEVTTDGTGFTGVLTGLLIDDSGLTVKFFTTGGVQKIEVHTAELTATTPPSPSYVSTFDWDETVSLNSDGSNTYTLLWYPGLNLVKLYVKDPAASTDRLLISGSTTAFPTIPIPERRESQPWAFFGHGSYPTQVSVSEWINVYLYNLVSNPVLNGIMRGEHLTSVTTNNPTYYEADTLPLDASSPWLPFPASFGTLGGAVYLTEDGLVLERVNPSGSVGYYRVEPKVTRKTILDFKLSGEVIRQESGVEATGIEIFIDDGVKQARIALLQDSSGTQYVGILKSSSGLGLIASYEVVVLGYSVERHYRLVFDPGGRAALYALITGDEGVEELSLVSLYYPLLPPSNLPGPGLGFLQDAYSGVAYSKMTLRQLSYQTDVEIVDWVDFTSLSPSWTKLGAGTVLPVTETGFDFARITDATSADNTYFKKEYPSVLQSDSGWVLEFRARVNSYDVDPTLSEYDFTGLDPIRAGTGFVAQVLDGTYRVALLFAEAGPPWGRVVYLALYDSPYENLLAIRSLNSSVSGSYYSIDWTDFHTYRLEKKVGGSIRLLVDDLATPVIEYVERLFDYPLHIGGGNARVEIGNQETGILTISDLQTVKFSISDGFDVSTKPVLGDDELMTRFNHATNVLVEVEDI